MQTYIIHATMMLTSLCLGILSVAATIAMDNDGTVRIGSSKNREVSRNDLMTRRVYRKEKQSSPSLTIYCYGGVERHVTDVFKTVSVLLHVVGSDYDVFRGTNDSEVVSEYDKKHAWFWFPLLQSSYRPTSLLLQPIYNSSCVGIHTSHQYSVHLSIQEVDPYRVAIFLAGTLLFLLAPVLCRNIVFYYSSGLLLGILGSTLILVYVLSRAVPGRRFAAYTLLLGGWSLTAYLLQYVALHLSEILTEYREYVMGYVLVVSLITFAVLYWRGPPSGGRALDLVQWGLQLVGVILVYVTSQVEEVSVAWVCILLVCRHLPTCLIPTSALRRWWRLRFPKKRRLLTEDEYLEQGSVETRRALAELQLHLQGSPGREAWRVVSRVRDPGRMAQWVMGEDVASHVTLREVMEHESDAECDLPRDEGDVGSDEGWEGVTPSVTPPQRPSPCAAHSDANHMGPVRYHATTSTPTVGSTSYSGSTQQQQAVPNQRALGLGPTYLITSQGRTLLSNNADVNQSQ